MGAQNISRKYIKQLTVGLFSVSQLFI